VTISVKAVFYVLRISALWLINIKGIDISVLNLMVVWGCASGRRRQA